MRRSQRHEATASIASRITSVTVCGRETMITCGALDLGDGRAGPLGHRAVGFHRSDLKAARTSVEKTSGSSQAAK
jgi:hypothetical protein